MNKLIIAPMPATSLDEICQLVYAMVSNIVSGTPCINLSNAIGKIVWNGLSDAEKETLRALYNIPIRIDTMSWEEKKGMYQKQDNAGYIYFDEFAEQFVGVKSPDFAIEFNFNGAVISCETHSGVVTSIEEMKQQYNDYFEL